MLDGVMPELGRDAKFKALGKEWTLSRRDMDVWDDMYKWAKDRLPDPFAGLDLLADKIPAGAGMEHPLVQLFNQKFSEAQQKAAQHKSMSSPEFIELFDTTAEGMLERFWLLLKINHPQITKTDAFLIVREIGERKQRELIEQADGKIDAGNPSAPAVNLDLRPGQESSTGAPSSTGS